MVWRKEPVAGSESRAMRIHRQPSPEKQTLRSGCFRLPAQINRQPSREAVRSGPRSAIDQGHSGFCRRANVGAPALEAGVLRAGDGFEIHWNILSDHVPRSTFHVSCPRAGPPALLSSLMLRFSRRGNFPEKGRHTPDCDLRKHCDCDLRKHCPRAPLPARIFAHEPRVEGRLRFPGYRVHPSHRRSG